LEFSQLHLGADDAYGLGLSTNSGPTHSIMRQLAVFVAVIIAAPVVVAQQDDERAALESLAKNLDDPHAQVRSQACYSLGKLGARARPMALKLGVLVAEDEIPSVRQMAAQALGNIALHTRKTPDANDRALVGLLAKAMRDPDAEVRLMAAQAIGNFMHSADWAAVSIAVVATSDGDKRVRQAAIRSLGMIGGCGGPEAKKTVPHLTQALSDPDPEIRRLATHVLGALGQASQPALPQLIETLRDGPPRAQEEAARTLGGLGPVAISAMQLLLEKVKQQRHLTLRGAAAKAIVRIDPTQLEAVVGILEKATRSKDSGIRMFALKALVEVDKKQLHIGPTLKRLQHDDKVEIQLIVAQAMEDAREIASQAVESQSLSADNEQDARGPEITLENATEAEANAALSMLRTFLDLWEKKDYAKAEALVDERVRLAWRKQMERRPMRLQSIDNIRVFKHKDELRARAHASTKAKAGLGLDLIFHHSKWWITAG
jgi:HEAT repeat protein